MAERQRWKKGVGDFGRKSKLIKVKTNIFLSMQLNIPTNRIKPLLTAAGAGSTVDGPDRSDSNGLS